MRKFKINRLVRDRIIPNIIAEGNKANFRILSNDEYISELKKKIHEEAEELVNTNDDEIPSELADVQEAIDNLIVANNIIRHHSIQAIWSEYSIGFIFVADYFPSIVIHMK